ncbi:hypothetical protein [Streptomyces sp. TE33382]
MTQSLGVKHVETVTFSMGTSEAEAKFQVAAASGVSEAHAFFESAANSSNPRLEVSRIGDESLAETAPSDDGKHQDKVLMLRVGTVIVIISGTSIEEQPFETARLEILGKMMAERAQQAQNGEAPVTSARNAGRVRTRANVGADVRWGLPGGTSRPVNTSLVSHPCELPWSRRLVGYCPVRMRAVDRQPTGRGRGGDGC